MPHFFLEILQKYCKDLLFWVLWTCLIMATKNDGICSRKLFDSYLHAKSQIYVFTLSYQDFTTLLLWVHVWPPIPKQQYLPVGNFDVYLHFFIETLHFNELSIWLAKSILTHNLRKWLLSDKRFEVKYMMFHWRLFLEKTENKSFYKAFKLLGYVFLY